MPSSQLTIVNKCVARAQLHSRHRQPVRGRRLRSVPSRRTTANRAHITLRSRLMLMATKSRKLEWACCKTKWVRLFISLLCRDYASLNILGNEFYAGHRWHVFIFRLRFEASHTNSKPGDWRSEIRIQKLTREGTWKRLKGHITILYALCTHFIRRRRYRLFYRYIDFLCFV